MRTLIIEDEYGPLTTLKKQISHYCPQLELLGHAESCKDGWELVKRHQPQLVFLDVELPDGTGFDFLDAIERIDFNIIFTTWHNEYAVKAFQYNALHYLMKPLLPDDLVMAVKRATEGSAIKPNYRPAGNYFRTGVLDRLAIPSVSKINYIALKELIRLQSDGQYTIFYCTTGQKIVSTKPLKEYHELLHNLGFFRAHRSHLINLSMVIEYRKGESDSIGLSDGTFLEISRKKRSEFLMAMNEYTSSLNR